MYKIIDSPMNDSYKVCVEIEYKYNEDKHTTIVLVRSEPRGLWTSTLDVGKIKARVNDLVTMFEINPVRAHKDHTIGVSTWKEAILSSPQMSDEERLQYICVEFVDCFEYDTPTFSESVRYIEELEKCIEEFSGDEDFSNLVSLMRKRIEEVHFWQMQTLSLFKIGDEDYWM